jgi:hypothetical protein
MPAENIAATLPKDFGKIPKDYDFSTRSNYLNI